MSLDVYSYALRGKTLQIIFQNGSFEAHPDSSGSKKAFPTFEDAAKYIVGQYPSEQISTNVNAWSKKTLREE